MRGKLLLFGTGALLLGVGVLASDAWKDKAYESWDQKDVQKILTDSPWSQKVEMGGGGVNAEGDGAFTPTGQAAHTDQSMGGGAGGPSGGGGGGGRGGNSGGSGGGAPMGGPQLTYTARWISSRTIREAYVRSEELSGKTGEDQKKSLSSEPPTYQVILLSRNLQPFQAVGEDALKDSMYLETKKNHQKIQAAKITFIKGEGDRVGAIVAEFPKKAANGEATFASDEKGADFVAEAGKTKLKFHFDFTKMQDKAGADL